MTVSITSITTVQDRTYQEELITPEIAAEYLKFNTHNRPLKEGRVAAYADDIREGRWRSNGESIKFSKTGRLIDGQNRLHAIIRADRPVNMLVVRGLDDRDQETMDIGCNRNLRDILKLRGETNSTNLAATIRALWIWDNTKDPGKRVVGGTSQRFPATSTLLLDYFEANDAVCRDITNKSEQCRKKTRIPTSVIAPLIREMERIDQQDADDFLNRLENMLPSPKNLGEVDPLVQLQKTLRRINENTKTRYTGTELAALIVKSWNAYRNGEPIKLLLWRSGGNSPELFPAFR